MRPLMHQTYDEIACCLCFVTLKHYAIVGKEKKLKHKENFSIKTKFFDYNRNDGDRMVLWVKWSFVASVQMEHEPYNGNKKHK